MRVIPELLELRAGIAPDRTAMIDGAGRKLTYREWQERTVEIAAGLLRRGVGAGDRVAIILPDRDILDFAAAYLAVQRVGACAVVGSTLWGDSENAALRELGVAGVVGTTPVPGADWCDTPTGLREGPSGVLRADADQLAQILFTSGSTGRPKAVAATHANLMGGVVPRLVTDQDEIGRGEYFVHAMPLGTNSAQSMLLTSLTLPDVTVVLDGFTPDAFRRAVSDWRATGTLLVPAMANTLFYQDDPGLAADLASLRSIGLTGGPTPRATLAKLATTCPHATISNFYTSTEAWPTGVHTEYDPARPESVGRVTNRTDVRLVGPDGAEARRGEVYLRSGADRGRGYVEPGTSRLARDAGWVATGDLGELDADGYLVLIDRSTRIINAGGFKVAPQEVESVLADHPGVQDVAVFDVAHPVLGSSVVAAVVPGRGPLDVDALRDHAADRLAPYKVPHRFHAVTAIPVNPAGKVDIRGLRTEFAALAHDHHPPRTPDEELICSIWARILGTGQVGRDDDFFDAGGHSIAAAQIVTLLNKEKGVRLPSQALYEARTPAGLAARLAASQPEDVAPQGNLPASAVGPLTAAQARQWAHTRVGPDGVRHHLANASHAVAVAGRLDVARLRAALAEVCRRQPALRTRFREDGDQVWQRTGDDPAITLEVVPVSGAVDQLVVERTAVRYDLTGPHLGTLTVIPLADGGTVLLMVAVHLIMDGWSLGVFFDELAGAYDGTLTALPEPFPAPGALARVEAVRHEDPYWRDVMAEVPPLPVFPRSRPADRPVGTQVTSRPVPVNVGAAVDVAARTAGVSPVAVFLAAYACVLASGMAGTRLTVVQFVLGRDMASLDRMVGNFSYPVPIPLTVSRDLSVRGLLRHVRDSVGAAQDHAPPPLTGPAGDRLTRLRRVSLAAVPEGAPLSRFGGYDCLPLPGELRDAAMPPGGQRGVALVLNVTGDGAGGYRTWLVSDVGVVPEPDVFLAAVEHVLTLMVAEAATRVGVLVTAAADRLENGEV